MPLHIFKLIKGNFGSAVIALLLMPVLAGCRMNNGDIGVLYGVWAVNAVEVDGQTYEGWNDDGWESFFEFQNNIVQVIKVSPLHDEISCFGTWQWVTEDTRIELDFTHHDDRFPEPGENIYAPPAWLLLTTPGVYGFDVVWHGEKKCEWSTVNTAGQRIKYYLKKTY